VGVAGDVYVAAPNGSFATFQLTLVATAIHLLPPIGLTADGFIVLDLGGPDGSEAQAVAGDLYLEVAEPLGSVVVRATGTIVVAETALRFVPEPGAVLLAVAAALGLACLGRRRARGRIGHGSHAPLGRARLPSR